MIKIAIVLGSTRPGRNGEAVANWVFEHSKNRTDAQFELIDIKDFDLPLLDEAAAPYLGLYTKAHTKRWSETIASFDAYVFVTPEYNYSTSAALKNAIDFLYKEWNNKVAGFVGYGGSGAIRAVEHLRLIMGALKVADVHTQVSLSLFTDFENFQVFKPASVHLQKLNEMIDQIVMWSKAMKGLRMEMVS
ncbi:NADPH-dependent FMN reductase [Chryseosolibacter indicus]|uniref:NAD(P)H-dependent oxidoreductase n=1 Tax=Chryseosolibacter indicus TaxID=2782351 RepID=A0ABS5VRM6_9BACT|nr:NAD(P)H-dependent oxidoreductase [Chryseosolibacter indicus]MBT1704100.1 NAD(P)H-dependent oxidoreductase [Chryseosolibacter indicus]